MLNYNHIKNNDLRRLTQLSESIQALPEAEAQALLDSLNSLPEEGQQAMLEALTKEQEVIQEALTDVQNKNTGIRAIKHEFETKVRTFRETQERAESESVAEQALEELPK